MFCHPILRDSSGHSHVAQLIGLKFVVLTFIYTVSISTVNGTPSNQFHRYTLGEMPSSASIILSVVLLCDLTKIVFN